MLRTYTATALSLALLLSFCCLKGIVAEDNRGGSRDLVRRLVSPNEAPSWPKRQAWEQPLFPNGYDHDAQTAIIGVWDKLIELREVAFDDLIAELDNRQYSATIMGQKPDWRNVSVGTICRSIIERQVNVCARVMRREEEGRRIPSWIVHDKDVRENYNDAVRRWWRKHSGKTLRELQLEATTWAIAYEKGKGFDDPEDESRIIGALQRIKKRLEESKEPIRVKRDGHFLEPDRDLEVVPAPVTNRG